LRLANGLANPENPRTQDPANDYRRIDVYHDGNRYSLWVAIFLANDRVHFTISLVSVDRESHIRKEVFYEIGRLCHEEEFTLVDGGDSDFIRFGDSEPRKR
jgi:hypothetical protein